MWCCIFYKTLSLRGREKKIQFQIKIIFSLLKIANYLSNTFPSYPDKEQWFFCLFKVAAVSKKCIILTYFCIIKQSFIASSNFIGGTLIKTGGLITVILTEGHTWQFLDLLTLAKFLINFFYCLPV